jgi:hypothetical protein
MDEVLAAAPLFCEMASASETRSLTNASLDAGLREPDEEEGDGDRRR